MRRWLVVVGVSLAATLPAWPAAPPTPPDIMPLLRKLGANQPLSDAETNRLTSWYGGGEDAGLELPDVGAIAAGENEPGTLTRNPLVQLALVKPPSRDEYQALAREVRRLYADRIDEPVRRKLDALLAGATRPGYGSDLGAVLLGVQAGPMAMYAMAGEALSHPTDAITANNLGVGLKGLHQYPRALRCLAYARALAPSYAHAATNLGWLQALMGDTVTGEQTLRAALILDPNDACAAEGLGLLELARGDGRGALTRLTAMLRRAHLPGACAGVQTVIDTDYIGGGHADAAGGDGADALPPLEPIVHPAGKGGGRPPTFDEPPEMGSPGALVANYDRIVAWCQKATQAARPIIEQHQAAGDRARKARRAREAQAEGTGVFYRTEDRERFVLHELEQTFGRRCAKLREQAGFVALDEAVTAEMKALQERFAAELAAAVKQGGEAGAAAVKAVIEQRCTALMALCEKTWARGMPAWQKYRTDVIKALLDYHDFATPWLQDVHDPDANHELNLALEVDIRMLEAATRAQLALLVGRCRMLYCVEPPKPREPLAGGTLQMWPDGPSDCRSAPLSMKLLAVSLEGNCDKLKFEAGEGLLLGVDYKVGKDWSDDELTVFAGVGVKGAAGPVDLKAKVGAYVTFRDGQVVDYGDRGEAKAEANLGPVQVGTKLEGRLSIESGATGKFTPVYAKVGAKVGDD